VPIAVRSGVLLLSRTAHASGNPRRSLHRVGSVSGGSGPQFRARGQQVQQPETRRLPACDHLAAWAERNAQFGTAITSELERRGVIAELASSNRVTRRAYSQTEGAGGLTWVRADEMVPLAATWRDLIQPFSEM